MAGVEVRDLGIGKLRDDLRKLGKLRILLGVQGRQAAEIHPVARVPQGLLAFWLHFGTARMRKRPYVDHAIAQLRPKLGALMARQVSNLIDGRASSPVAALEPIGAAGVEAVTDAIDDANSWVDWDLSEATIARKGHDRHLVDTGATRDATSYTIRDGDNVLASGGAK